MANPEHIKILQKGKDAIEQWYDTQAESISTEDNGLDLSRYDFSGHHFYKLELRNACFTKSRLQKAAFSLCNLMGACMDYADMQNSRISEVDLSFMVAQGADFSNASIEQTNFYDANLKASKFCESALETLSFINTDLSYCDLSGSTIRDTTFIGAKLQGAELTGIAIDRVSFVDSLTKDIHCDYLYIFDRDKCHEDFEKESADFKRRFHNEKYVFIKTLEPKYFIRTPSEGCWAAGDFKQFFENPPETGQDATSDKKNSKLDFFYNLYEKTLKALFSAVIEAMKS